MASLVGTQMPLDAVGVYVDGAFRQYLTDSNEWTQLKIVLPPGGHTVLLSYITNPNGLAELPPQNDDHREAAYFDNAYFIPSGVTSPPTVVSLSLFYYLFYVLPLTSLNQSSAIRFRHFPRDLQ